MREGIKTSDSKVCHKGRWPRQLGTRGRVLWSSELLDRDLRRSAADWNVETATLVIKRDHKNKDGRGTNEKRNKGLAASEKGHSF